MKMTGGTARPKVVPFIAQYLQPVWHLSKHIPGKRRADAGQDLGQARYGKANAECDNKCLSLEAIAQQAVGKSDGAPNQQNQDDRDGRWNSQPYQIEQAHIRRPNDKRDRQIQTAKQGHEGLTTDANPRNEAKTSIDLIFAPDTNPLTCNAATTNKAARTIRPMKALRLSTNTRLTTAIRMIAAASTSAVRKFSKEKKPVTVSRENSEAEGQNQKSAEHAGSARYELAKRRTRGNRFARRWVPHGEIHYPADKVIAPNPDQQRKYRRGIEDHVQRQEGVAESQTSADGGNDDGNCQT